jgi:hypothetical protein
MVKALVQKLRPSEDGSQELDSGMGSPVGAVFSAAPSVPDPSSSNAARFNCGCRLTSWGQRVPMRYWRSGGLQESDLVRLWVPRRRRHMASPMPSGTGPPASGVFLGLVAASTFADPA